MGRAMRVLWAGETGPRPAAIPLMAAGMGVLVLLAATLGQGFKPLEYILEGGLAEIGLIVPLLGLGAGLSGLGMGWFIAPARLLGPLMAPARNGFAVAGGMDALILRPALALAAACAAFEARLLAAQIGMIRRLGPGIARLVERSDAALYGFSLWIGRQNLHLGARARLTDTNGIDALIFGLVARTIAAGARARRLQSGFIHRELALTFAGIALVTGVLLAAPYFL